MPDRMIQVDEYRRFETELDSAIDQVITDMLIDGKCIKRDDGPEEEISCGELIEDKGPEEMYKEEFNEALKATNVKQRRIARLIANRIKLDREGKAVSPFRLFITGGASAGKTFLLKLLVSLIQIMYRSDSEGNFVKVMAPTGIAAILINGQTLHSSLKLPVEKN